MAIGKGCCTCILEKWKKIHPIPYCFIRFPTTDLYYPFLEQDGVKGQPCWVLVQCSRVQQLIAVIWVGVLESCGYPEVTVTIPDNPVHMHMAGIPILPIASTWKASADSTASEPPPKAQGMGPTKCPKNGNFFGGNMKGRGQLLENQLFDSILGAWELNQFQQKYTWLALIKRWLFASCTWRDDDATALQGGWRRILQTTG